MIDNINNSNNNNDYNYNNTDQIFTHAMFIRFMPRNV